MLLAVARRPPVLVAVGASLVGAALLVWQVRQAGAAELAALLAHVGAGFLGILALSLARLLLRSLAWVALIGPGAPPGRALAAVISGDAVGHVTPLSLLVSEPAKALFLGRNVPPARAFAALAAENFFYAVTVAVYVILGTAAMLAAFDLSPALERAGLFSLALMAAVLLVAGWLALARPSVLSALAAALPGARAARLAERVRTVEQNTYGAVAHRSGRIAAVIALDTLFHALSFAEAWLTVWLLTGVSSPLAAFVLDAANRVVNVLFRMVPFRVGVDEVTSEAVALSVGLPPAIGTATALVRKGRVLVWAGVGFGLLAGRGFRR